MNDPARTPPGAPSTPTAAPLSAWSPLADPIFRALWIAALASNVGTWMQEVGAAWLMTSLSPSPLMVALVQAATTLPIFLLALPAGALADVVDRRRLLITTQTWMLLATGLLGALTLLGATTPWVLLTLTFVIGLGAALNAPAWQAIIPELVTRPALPAALALNGIAINLARAVGPALGGLVVAAAGPWAAFLLNSVSFTGVVVVLYRWRREVRRSALPAERMIGAMTAGLRYVRHAPDLRAVMMRSGAFILFGSALWALLPVVARFELGVGPTGYGLLLGCLGAGAVGGAALLPRLRRAVPINTLVASATLIFATVILLVGLVRSYAPMCLVMVAGGGAWLTLLTSFHSSAQGVLAGWVRGRALAVYLLVFFGGMAGGSALWGMVASHAGPSAALGWAGLGLVAALALTARYRLTTGEGLDLAPSRHWPAPAIVDDAEADRGPVLITVEYRVDPARAAEFARAMRDVRRVRRRDGAFRWDLFNDSEDEWRFLESFFVESWLEHLRQHERLTVDDREFEKRARLFHVGPEPPVVTHFIAREVPR
ncbi:MAG TPA: MFS transporter [Candidatus Polarisedimenticolia bacterium]|nr:MFS transporter [Candidatus Polarisedimenticolia bacterium]